MNFQERLSKSFFLIFLRRLTMCSFKLLARKNLFPYNNIIFTSVLIQLSFKSLDQKHFSSIQSLHPHFTPQGMIFPNAESCFYLKLNLTTKFQVAVKDLFFPHKNFVPPFHSFRAWFLQNTEYLFSSISRINLTTKCLVSMSKIDFPPILTYKWISAGIRKDRHGIFQKTQSLVSNTK